MQRESRGITDIMEDSACAVPKTPQVSSLERGVRRPNRMSLLLAAKTNLFSGGDSILISYLHQIPMKNERILVFAKVL